MKKTKTVKKIFCLFILGIMLSFSPAAADTTEILNHIAMPVLKQGMEGEDIGKLQAQLSKYGYYHGNIDGNFSYKTLEAVLHFQQDCALEADGIVGEQTWSAIKNYAKNEVSRSLPESRKGHQISIFAQKHLGTKYVWGGSAEGGFDCSGFISYIFRQHGIALPRMADEQFNAGAKISKANLRAGDMVFFSTYEPGPSHVGVYIGNGNFIHASSAAGQVVVTSISSPYYSERFLGARRLAY